MKARERIAAALTGGFEHADEVIAALGIPEADLDALISGTSVVVPVEPTAARVHAMTDTWFGNGSYAQRMARVYAVAISARPNKEGGE